MTQLQFKCPACGDTRLECVESDTVVSSVIKSIAENGDFDYEQPNIEGGYVARFQCVGCGYALEDDKGQDVTDNLEVVKWLKKHRKQTEG